VNHSLQVQHSFGRFEPGALAPSRPIDGRHADGGLAAYVGASPIEVLVARFPVIRRLVGDESFRAMARRFIVSEPPRSPTLLHYGEMFPRILRGLGGGASIEYVANIAELEMVRGKACHSFPTWPSSAKPISSWASAKTHEPNPSKQDT
jgi:Putative DNA-binding domain